LAELVADSRRIRTFTLFRRAKLWLDGVPGEAADNAFELGVLVARLGLTDGKSNPLCGPVGPVRPPLIAWSAAAPALPQLGGRMRL